MVKLKPAATETERHVPHRNTALLALPADLSSENPYEDVELESQCSQQSLPSSPGADSSKVAAQHQAFIHTLF